MSLKSDLQKFKPRNTQIEALDYIDNQYKSNPMSKFFLLNLPVGTGKSHLALMIADWYKKNVNKTGKVDVITNTKILQDQYVQTYDSISDLKGKENYYCKTYACSCAQGEEFNKLNKTTCDDCPHKNARDQYMGGNISLTNFYLYVLYAIYNKKLFESRESKVLIVDECHEFDDVISNFISIKITENTIKRFKFRNQGKILNKLNKISNIKSYVEFLDLLFEEINSTIEELKIGLQTTKRNVTKDKRKNKISKVLNSNNPDINIMKMVTDLKQLNSKIEFFKAEYKQNPKNWVLESTWNQKNKKIELSLEPLWAYDYLDRYIFSKYDMVFLMSGTILDKNLFSYLNGLEINKTIYYSIESPFNVKNRPIYYMPIGKMSYKKKENTFKKYVPYIKKILKKYKNQKGIIHTNSFELSNWIKNEIKDPRLVFHDSSNKDEILENHKKSEQPTVIVSPSVSNGVSFDNDFARFQIIAKIPYPSLASQKNKYRQRENPRWYAWKTVAGIIQMSGRTIRSNKDWADTIIIDESFSDVIRHSSDLMPDWFQKAIKKVNLKK